MSGSSKSRRGFPERLRTNFIWIIFVLISWYIFISGFTQILGWQPLMHLLHGNVSSAMYFTLDMYACTIMDIITLCVLTNIFSRNRYIWKSFLLPARRHSSAPARSEADLTGAEIIAGATTSGSSASDHPHMQDTTLPELYGRSRNSFAMLGKGLLLGFLTNFFCIICAILHGDIKLYLDCSPGLIPYFLFSLLCVCIQSSAEELWCRGFLYERLHERYPLWVAVMINGVLFGLLHVFNPGASALPIAGIIVCGISYSLLRWYSGSIWIAMGIHTGWNFTQNYLFGLPNSGLVSEASVFHLDAAVGSSSIIYDWNFGVEGGIPSVFIDALLGFIILTLAYRSGRLRELTMNRSQIMSI